MTDLLAGKKILVVEDEYFIASDLKRALEREGAVVIGPVGDVARAFTLLGESRPDAAILDVNLEGATSYGIAERLNMITVPYMFLTGYDGWALPEAYRDAPRLAKPFSMRSVLDCVGRLLKTDVDA
jgi:DNA-binding response OmpR family regulator